MPEWQVLARALKRDIDFSDLFPCSADDVALFLEYGQPEFAFARIQHLQSYGLRTCDVLAFVPGTDRCMVWQGIRLSMPTPGSSDWIDYPACLAYLPKAVKERLETSLVVACRAAGSAEMAGSDRIVQVDLSPAEFALRESAEQFIPSSAGYRAYVEHIKRYMFAAEFCAARSVLDLNCGAGDGTKMLANAASSCIGLDSNAEAVRFAGSAYPAENLRYVAGGLTSLPAGKQFDLVVCFDAIQHVPKQDRDDYVAGIARVLEPGGKLIIACPNARRADPSDQSDVPMHRQEFYSLLARHFGTEHVDLFGQSKTDADLLEAEFNISEDSSPNDDVCIAVCQKLVETECFRLFPAKKYKASIIIPVHNQVSVTRNCLEAIAESTSDELEYEVVIIDNASTDGTADLLASLEGDVGTIRNNLNLGFGTACNQGARAATGEHLVFLNNDTIPQPGWLESMIRLADGDPDIGVVGPMILSQDGSVETIGRCFSENGVPKPACGGYPCDHPVVRKPREMQAVSGTCMLVQAALFQELGGFAEQYFMYHEDVDLCLRAGELGRKVMFCPDARVVHYSRMSSVSGSDADGFARDSLQPFLKRWHGRVRCDGRDFAAPDMPRPSAGWSIDTAPIVWHAPVLDPSGYADEARNFIFALDGRCNLALEALNWSKASADLETEQIHAIRRLAGVQPGEAGVHVWHILPRFFQVIPDGMMTVGRTMFESDRLPAGWAEACNLMDEIWVPSEFNIGTFADSGVHREKLVKIPGAVDLHRFNPSVSPMSIPDATGFRFLCNLDWRLRKGWDVLLEAYCREFGQYEDVTLVIKAYASENKTTEMIHREANAFITGLGLDPYTTANIVFLDGIIPSAELPSLYAAADAYVQPSRGEAWGRTYSEAMAMELPTIGTRWSGNLEFMNDDTSYLIDCELVDVPESDINELKLYQGHRWAEPSVEHLRRLMRRVFEDRQAARETGRKARAHLEQHYSYDRIADLVLRRVERSIADKRRN